MPLRDELPREAIAGDGRDFAAVDRIRYTALRDGVIAADARLRMAEGVAQLVAAAGMQAALLRYSPIERVSAVPPTYPRIGSSSRDGRVHHPGPLPSDAVRSKQETQCIAPYAPMEFHGIRLPEPA